jgi:hypothetical protein
MKRNVLATLVAGLLLVPPVFAQHGRGGMGPMGSGPMGNSGPAGNSGNVGRDNNTRGNPNDTATGPKSPQQLLDQNQQLTSNLQNLLNKYPGLTPQQACQGFKNLGQCVAAIHLSKNLNVNFYCLRADRTGTTAGVPQGTSCPSGTGSKTMSLGQSIQQLDPQANAKAEAKTANKQASQDLKQSRS